MKQKILDLIMVSSIGKFNHWEMLARCQTAVLGAMDPNLKEDFHLAKDAIYGHGFKKVLLES